MDTTTTTNKITVSDLRKLTHTQTLVVLALQERPAGPVALAELAQAIGRTPASARKAVTALVQCGVLDERPSKRGQVDAVLRPVSDWWNPPAPEAPQRPAKDSKANFEGTTDHAKRMRSLRRVLAVTFDLGSDDHAWSLLTAARKWVSRAGRYRIARIMMPDDTLTLTPTMAARVNTLRGGSLGWEQDVIAHALDCMGVPRKERKHSKAAALPVLPAVAMPATQAEATI